MTEYKKPYRGEPSKPFTEEELLKVGPIINSYVPYQRCPICEGTGTLRRFDNYTVSDEICDVCNGKKIIPMHIK